MAKLISEHISTLDVLDAYVCENSAPIARVFAERLMSARRGDLGPVGPTQPALKRTYAEVVGMIARKDGSISRTDWAATWQDTARANMLRRAEKVGKALGLWPVAVQTDALYYAAPAGAGPEILVVEHLGVGSAPGLFKYQGALTVAEYRDKLRIAS